MARGSCPSPVRPLRRKGRSKEVLPDPTLPVARTDALPGSAEKIEAMALRYQKKQMLHAAGDVLDDPSRSNHYKRGKNGADENTGLTAEVDPAADGAKTRRHAATLFSGAEVENAGAALVGPLLVRWFARYLAARKLTYGQLADMTGLPRGHLWNLATGRRRNPHISTLYLLAVALDVSLDEMLGRSRPGRAS